MLAGFDGRTARVMERDPLRDFGEGLRVKEFFYLDSL
jgi:hypothetical protein